MLTIQYGPAHLSLNHAPARSSAPCDVVAPPAALMVSPTRQMTVSDGCPLGPNKSKMRSESPRLSVLKISFCHTNAVLTESGLTTRRQPFSSVRIPESAAVILVILTKFRCGSSETQAEAMISSRADSESRAEYLNVYLLVRTPATRSPKGMMRMRRPRRSMRWFWGGGGWKPWAMHPPLSAPPITEHLELGPHLPFLIMIPSSVVGFLQRSNHLSCPYPDIPFFVAEQFA